MGEVIEGGNADKSGLVDAGDQLIATSAIVYGLEEEYQGVTVRKGMQKVRLNVRGERFKTVCPTLHYNCDTFPLRTSICFKDTAAYALQPSGVCMCA